MRFSTLSFLSDYGLRDGYVGAIHSVVRSLAPDVTVIDITHQIAPYDVKGGGLALARSVAHLAPGVVLANVNPAAKVAGKPVAIEVADGESYLVGPNNGLLAPAVAMVGGATAAVTLDAEKYHLASIGSVSPGRDILAPAAAQLCLGTPLASLGSALDVAKLFPAVMPVSELSEDGSLSTQVLWIDRYGNVQLNVDPQQVADWPEQALLTVGGKEHSVTRVADVSELPTTGLAMLADSYGLLSIVSNRMSAAEILEVDEDAAVVLRKGKEDGGVSVPVTLGKTRSGDDL